MEGRFKRGCQSVQYDPREGRLRSATTPEIIEEAHDMIWKTRVRRTVKLTILRHIRTTSFYKKQK